MFRINARVHLMAAFGVATRLLSINGSLVGTQPVAGAIVTSTGTLRIGGKIGRVSCWERVKISVVDVSLKKKKPKSSWPGSTWIAGSGVSVVSNQVQVPGPCRRPLLV